MQRGRYFLKIIFFFLVGALATGLVMVSSSYLVFVYGFKDRVYPGVTVGGRDFSGQTKKQVIAFWNGENLDNVYLEISSKEATVSAKAEELNLKPDSQLMAMRAWSIGRQTKNPYYNLIQIVAAYQGRINLPLEVNLDDKGLGEKLEPFRKTVEKQPVDAVFRFVSNSGPDQRGRVVAFSPSASGIEIDIEQLKKEITDKAKDYLFLQNNLRENRWVISLPTKEVLPKVSSSTADEMGIKDLLGKGESYFYDSIPGRIHNIELGTSKINGRLVAPSEIFSFDEAIGTVSAIFGYQKAYSIIKGKTVLDDGGGVCQVSTTLYRAVLKAGLPVVERVAHSYRVGFYEQGGFLPGMDATVYPPAPDFRFKNDTGSWILIQTNFDPEKMKLTFDLFGSGDGRKTEITGPVILSTSPPPEPVYEDDPTLPTGEVKQVDTAHYGAKVYFKRKVTRREETLIDETVSSDYVPWPARFLRGTKI